MTQHNQVVFAALLFLATLLLAVAIVGIFRSRVRSAESKSDVQEDPTEESILKDVSDRSTRHIADDIAVDDIAVDDIESSTARAKDVIETRECCKLNGSQGKQYCNICGRPVPDDWIV